MGKNSKIEWTDDSFAPWFGCTKVSAACDHCYAEDMTRRYKWAEWGNHPRIRSAQSTWDDVKAWDRLAKRQGRRRRVFCSELSDVFDNQAPDEWRRDLWRLISQTPNLDWLLLTKRPQNIAKMLPPTWRHGWAWPNVWLGTTTENQQEADRRIPMLCRIPAVVRFLSCEPLLEPITPALSGIHWVICGGESGHNARYMDPAWAYSLREQCERAGVAFFMKQMSIPKKNPIPPDLMTRDYLRAYA